MANETMKALPETKVGLLVIGAGPAGLAAAVAAYDRGVRDILICERQDFAGGILPQCIHNGFGLKRFGEELTGPEYAGRYEKMAEERGIKIEYGATVTKLSDDRRVTVLSEEGMKVYAADAVILAMGCRERPRGALPVVGTRPAGIYTAGCAQKMVNRMGLLPGREIVILGSGDIGLIMARRMTLEGAHVKAVCEVMDHPGGLRRNIVQCLDDFGIPLYLSTTVVEVEGEDRLTAVTVAEVDERRRPIPGTERRIECDTLLLSVGLIPENELTRQAGITIDPVTNGAAVRENRETSIPGVFACGNVLHVHDLVDFVSEEGEIAGNAAADYLANKEKIETAPVARITAKNGVRYTVPEYIGEGDTAKVTVFFRVSDSFRDATLVAENADGVILSKKVRRMVPGEMQRVDLPREKLVGEVVLSVAPQGN